MKPSRFGIGIILALLSAAVLIGYRQMTPEKARYVLAASWQPAFCETRSRLPECRSQTSERYDAAHFSLHGLWPQPRSKVYCGVDQNEIRKDKEGRWQDISWPRLDQELWNRLRQVMPGTRSGLHKHEWVKHGTCYDAGGPEKYFTDSLHLMDELNRSSVRDLFASRIGQQLTGPQIRAAFDRSFGAGAGDRVRISCKTDKNRRLIVELTIGLSGTISSNSKLSELMAAAPATKPGCPSGIVDAIGLQ